MKHVVKRRGLEQHYDSKKVYASAFAAARNAHLSERESEKIGDEVTKAIDTWMEKKDEISSDDIFKKITEELKKYDPDASFLYKTHRDVN